MKYLDRNLINEVIKWIGRKEILAIKGPRQAGKTTLLFMLKNYLLKIKNVSPKNIIYLTFEDIEIRDNFSKNPKDFILSYLYQKKNTKLYFLIDEFQYLENGGQKIKFLFDSFPNIKFIITGSSSLELMNKTSKYLVGRMFSFELFPFSFSEFIQNKPENIVNYYYEKTDLLKKFILKNKTFKISKSIFLDNLIKYFNEYIIWGGYPEVAKTTNIETKNIILKNIFSTYITKDIIELLKLDDVSGLKKLLEIIASQMGSLVNYNNISNDIQLHFRRLKHYLSILEETYVIKSIRPFSKNRITELKKNPKIYFIDIGLRNYIIKNFSEINLRPDKGALYENFVLSQILPGKEKEIKFWRTTSGAEVDFIINIDNKIIPVEIKSSFLKKPQISKSFLSFLNEYQPDNALILNNNLWHQTKINKTKLMFAPLLYFPYI